MFPGRHAFALLALSLALVAPLQALHLPAAILLGCMAAGMAFGGRDVRLRIPSSLFVVAQAVVGCLIARSLRPAIVAEIVKDWPTFLAAVFAVVAASSALGWLLMRRRVLPGTTAVWGLAPGAATAMTLMADAYGADTRLVAVMQYLRVVLVTVVASAVSRLWVTAPAQAAAGVQWLAPVAWRPLAATLLVALLAAALARRWRIPAGGLLLSLAFAGTLQGAGLLRIELPPLLLAAAYALVGWSIGLRFTRQVLIHAARALPRILASILLLIVLCMGFAALLSRVAHIDPLTAYLATSPGGADSVAIIAASSPVDVPFVMAMQMARFIAVLLIGPRLYRFIAGRSAA